MRTVRALAPGIPHLSPMPLDWRPLTFYVAVPLALALFSTVANPERVGNVGFWPFFLFNTLHAVGPWWLTCLCSRGVMKALRPWRPPLLVITVAGVMIASVVCLPYT